MADSPAKSHATSEAKQPAGLLARKSTPKKQENKQERARESVHKVSPKNGIPPKRTMVGTDKKPNPATPPAHSKPTASSIARHAPSGSISKTSSRPLSIADGFRSQNATAASNASISGPKLISSTSAADRLSKRSDSSLRGKGEDGEVKPSIPSNREQSASPVRSSLKSSSKPPTLSSSATTSKKPRPALSSILNSASSGGTEDLQVQHVTKGVHNGHLATSPAKAKPISSGSVSKRLKRIPGSPSVKTTKPLPTPPASNRSISPQKKVRPGLGTRKSTMSVTIEQRLREMSLVHQMLHAAMAEEDGEADEVKEAYGKQMDDTLATLKARLAEARKEEGLVGSAAAVNRSALVNRTPIPPIETDDSVADTTDTSNIDTDFPQKWTEDHVTRCLGEEGSVTVKQPGERDESMMNEDSSRKLELAQLELRKGRSDYDSLRVSSDLQVKGLQNAIDTMTNKLHNVQASLQTKESEVASLERANEVLQEKIKELESESKREIHQHRRRVEDVQRDQTQVIEERDTAFSTIQVAVQELGGEIDELEASRQHEEQYFRHVTGFLDPLWHSQDPVESELSRHRADTDSLERQNQEDEYDLERLRRITSVLQNELNEVKASKNRELDHQQEAIEALQDTIRQGHEMQERELQDVKHSLAQEHEEAIFELRLELDHALAKEVDKVRQQGDSKQLGDHAIQQLRDTYQAEIEQLRAALACVRASNSELRRSAAKDEECHDRKESQLEMELASSMDQVSGLRAEIHQANQQSTDLEEERSAAQSSVQSNAEMLAQLSDEVASLNQQLTTSNNANLTLHEKVVHVEEELAATKTFLDELREEKHQLSGDREHELECARTLRAELEYRCFTAEDAHDDLELRNVMLQTQVTALRADDAERRQEVADLACAVAPGRKVEEEQNSQLGTRKAETEKLQTRVRELESALKVTTAELVELRTERPSGSSFSGSPIPKAGLRSSRWAREPQSEEGHYDASLLAGMREHLRQIDFMNEEMLDNHQRVISKIDGISKSPQSSPVISFRHVKASPAAAARGRYTAPSTSEGTDES
ncbi:MAG: hypothetical protein LQ344_000065 [Seirophora lacunosa]|nr:MAG: hypothetical protein LQ344_000065 [Seirophora lacunosa]